MGLIFFVWMIIIIISPCVRCVMWYQNLPTTWGQKRPPTKNLNQTSPYGLPSSWDLGRPTECGLVRLPHFVQYLQQSVLLASSPGSPSVSSRAHPPQIACPAAPPWLSSQSCPEESGGRGSGKDTTELHVIMLFFTCTVLMWGFLMFSCSSAAQPVSWPVCSIACNCQVWNWPLCMLTL